MDIGRRVLRPHLILLFATLLVLAGSPFLVVYSLYHTPSPPQPPIEESEVVEITIRGSEFKLEPNAIWIPKAGVTVKITFINDGRVTHALSVEGFGSTGLVAPGGSATLEFNVEEPMLLAIWCPVGDHRERGMEGVLVVGMPKAETVTRSVTVTVTSIETTTEYLTETTTATVVETETQTTTRTVLQTVTETVSAVPGGSITLAVILIVGLAAGYILSTLFRR